jgi:hypothetical protein
MQDAQRAWNDRLASASTSAAKALQKEREGDLVTAYSLCLQTAQSYLWLIRNTEDASAKEKLKAASAKLLIRAEKIKAVRPQASPAPISFLNECA